MRNSVRVSARATARRLVVAGLLSSLFAALAPAALAQSAARGGRTDAETYAAMMDVSLEEAQRRLAIQVRLGELESKLHASAGEIFAGLWIEHQPKFAARTLFTDTARGQELVRAFSAGLGIEIEVGWAAASWRELEALQTAAVGELRAAGIAADADIDLRANRVEIETTAAEGALRALAGVAGATESRVVVVAVAELSQPEQLAPMRGGRPLTSCSAGFTARNASGSIGMLSAGHCSDSQIYWDTFEVLPFASRQYSGSRDVGFYHRGCGLTGPNEFDSGLGIRQVTGTRTRDQQVVGSMVCRFGMTTPYRCGLIHSKNICPSYVSGCSSTFIRVRPTDGLPLSAGGDSGGPWFLETIAYGIHSGRVTGTNDAVYMAINYASTTATVLTANGGTGFPTGTLSCSGNYQGSTNVWCSASASGGRPPYSYTNWLYWGDADLFSSSGNYAEASYPVGGCFANAENYFSVRITDSCGVVGGASRTANCPDGCIYGRSEDGSASDASIDMLPPPIFCPAF